MRQIRRHIMAALIVCTLVGGYDGLALAEHDANNDPAPNRGRRDDARLVEQEITETTREAGEARDTPTRQISRGARLVGEGITGTAREVGDTVVEGVKRAGETLRQTGETVVPATQNAWEQVRDGVTTIGRKVETFFERLF